MSDDTARTSIMKYLRVGPATPSALLVFLGPKCDGARFERVMTAMELDGSIIRDQWGALSVWRQRKLEDGPIPEHPVSQS